MLIKLNLLYAIFTKHKGYNNEQDIIFVLFL